MPSCPGLDAWQCPFLGLPVSFVSPAHTRALFLEFGNLIRSEGNDAVYPKGEYTLASFAAFPGWTLQAGGHAAVTSDDEQAEADRGLQHLLGRTLTTLTIDSASCATHLEFSPDVTLDTETISPGDQGKPHWLFQTRDGNGEWLVIARDDQQPRPTAEWKGLFGH